MWGIPLARVAGVLAVTYTGGTEDRERSSASQAPPSVQRPEPQPPVLPPDEPTSAAVDPLAEPPPPETEPEPEAIVAPPPGPMPDEAPRTEAPLMEEDPAPLGEPATDPEAPSPDRERGKGTGKELLRPTDQRRFFSIGVGGAAGGTSPYSAYLGGGMDFQWEMAIGGHSRKRPTFGGAFVIQQRKGFINELSFVGRFQWDKPFSDAFAIYSSVNLDLGVNVPIGYGPYLGFVMPPSAMIGAGWGVKAIVAERLLIFARPVNPNLVAPAFYNPPLFVTIRWDVMAGLGTVW